jgi:two-component system, response regulator PdtaR
LHRTKPCWSLSYGWLNVRFGSLADIEKRIRDVRFTPESRHVAGLSSMSAMCQKRTLLPLEIWQLVGSIGDQLRSTNQKHHSWACRASSQPLLDGFFSRSATSFASRSLYVCGVAHTQAGARSLADSEHPDVILMDVSLEGGREGIEAARSLREAYGAEVIFVTGSTDQYTLDQIHKQVPGAPVVPKPVHHRRLAEAVGALL